jgi:hypothetical protein
VITAALRRRRTGGTPGASLMGSTIRSSGRTVAEASDTWRRCNPGLRVLDTPLPRRGSRKSTRSWRRGQAVCSGLC